MQSLVINAPRSASLADAPEPSPGNSEVLLAVRTAGFCGTDLSTFRGTNPLVSYPRIPGHELGCTILEVGHAVPSEFNPGQNVIVHPYTSCGRCFACRSRRPNCCQRNETLGVQRNGGLAERITVPYDKLYTSEKLSLREMALVEPLTIGHHAVSRGRIEPSDFVGVLGCGAIGIGVIAAAAERGATVIAIDVADAKLELALRVGAAHTINSSRDDLHTSLAELTDGQAPNVMIEAVGLPQTYRTAIEEVAHAGRVVTLGYAKQPIDFDTSQFVLRELDILGSRNALPENFRQVIAYLETGRFPVDDVITHSVSLADAADALAAWDADPAAVTKIHVEF